MAPCSALVWRVRSAGLVGSHFAPSVLFARASKSISSPTMARARSRALVLAAPSDLNHASRALLTLSCVLCTAALAEPGCTAATIKATAMGVTKSSSLVGRARMPQASANCNLQGAARRLLERRPGELRVVEGFQPRPFRPGEEQRVLQQLARLAQAGVEGHAGLRRKLLADLRLLRVAVHLDARFRQIAQRLLQLQPHQLLRADLDRLRLVKVGLRLAHPRELLRDVEGAL